MLNVKFWMPDLGQTSEDSTVLGYIIDPDKFMGNYLSDGVDGEIFQEILKGISEYATSNQHAPRDNDTLIMVQIENQVYSAYLVPEVRTTFEIKNVFPEDLKKATGENVLTVKKLIRQLQKYQGGSPVSISLDMSTGEANSELRSFSDEFIGYRDDDGGGVVLKFTGVSNDYYGGEEDEDDEDDTPDSDGGPL